MGFWQSTQGCRVRCEMFQCKAALRWGRIAGVLQGRYQLIPWHHLLPGSTKKDNCASALGFSAWFLCGIVFLQGGEAKEGKMSKSFTGQGKLGT